MKHLFNVKNTVRRYNIHKSPPKYVLDTLALVPRNSILTKFDQNDVQAELDNILSFRKEKKLDDETITDIT